MKKYKVPVFLRKRSKMIGILFISLIIFINFTSFTNLTFKETYPDSKNKPKMSWFWATLDLTNPGEVNNSIFTRSTYISVKGRIYNKIDNSSKSFVNVAIEVDDIVDLGYTDITDGWGRFDINYLIDPSIDIYSSHKIEVTVTDSEPGGPGSEIEYHDFYIIYINATSYFNITSHDNPSIPKLTEEDFNLNGFLNYGNRSGIPSASVNYYWLDDSTVISQGSFPTDSSGSLMNLQVPITLISYLTLKFNYTDPPYVDYNETYISNIPVFSDITWDLNIDYSTTEGEEFTLAGTILSSTDPSLRISNRSIEILYNGTVVDTTPNTIITASDGSFSATFQIPERNGTASIQVRLIDSAGRDIRTPIQNILVEEVPPSLPTTGGLPPFFLFSIIFFPILAVIVAVLVVYGIKFYKKQEEVSRVVNLPLESRIKNLKILKDSGRLEESISYLFNAIYMDLIDAKYSRRRKVNETIRDFAIISVKELKLTPASIYPFIQKVEEIIYAKPFKISEQDFYGTCELFSPIYFQLTGYNFILNF